jgi:hypothetical protein
VEWIVWLGVWLVIVATFLPAAITGLVLSGRSRRALAGTSRHADMKASGREHGQTAMGVFLGQMLAFFAILWIFRSLPAAVSLATLIGLAMAWSLTRSRSDDLDPREA